MKLRQKVIEIDDVAHLICNDWEYKFIKDMVKKCDRGKFEDENFSSKEKKKIEKLYEKACNSPY